MEFIRGWVISIATATLIISVAAALCPKNTAGRTVMMCGSLIMTAVLISPLKGFDTSLLNEYGEQYEREIEVKSEKLRLQNEELRQDIIEENLRAYILQRAKTMEIECDVQISCKGDLPYSAYVDVADEEKALELSRLIESECGIPKARQTFKREVA